MADLMNIILEVLLPSFHSLFASEVGLNHPLLYPLQRQGFLQVLGFVLPYKIYTVEKQITHINNTNSYLFPIAAITYDHKLDLKYHKLSKSEIFKVSN